MKPFIRYQPFSALLIAILALVLPAEAQKKRKGKKTQSARAKALSPQEQLKTFTLPEGFVIELVASEKNGLVNPIDLTFDDTGRLWTQTAEMYPLDPNSKLVGRKVLDAVDKGTVGKQGEFKRIKDLYQLKTRGKDKILVIPNPTQEVTGQIHAFAEGMTIPQSILPYKNGVFVAHGSEMLYLEDTDGDRKFDQHQTILTGFGYTDSHTMSHTLVRGPGGWVHFSHGALNKGKVTAVKSGKTESINFSKIVRFSLGGEQIEIVNNGLNNIWGFQLKGNGQWYGSEANDIGWSLTPLHPQMGYKGIGNEKIRPYQPFPDAFHAFKVNGTGISGLAYDENGSKGFPAKWKNVGFLANPITSTINCVIADRAPDGSVISKHLPDFLACSDDWFRPVNIEFGPDGCLYIVDWYNKIVSHNEVSRDHPDRDKSHGRIWRIRHVSQKSRPIPDIIKASNGNLLKHLTADIQWEKRAAWHQIVDRQATELTPALIKLAQNTSQTLETRILALWSLEGLKAYDLALLKSLTGDKEANLRREALRSLASFKPSVEDVVTLTKPLINDPHYMVKEQLLNTLREVNVANEETISMLVSASNPQKDGKNQWGTNYKSNHQRFLALMALEQYPSELRSFIDSAASKNVPQPNLNEATKILPKGQRTEKILAALQSGKAKLDANTLIALSEGMAQEKVLKALQTQLATKEFIELALKVQPSLRSSSLQKAIVPGLKKLIVSSSTEDQKLAVKAAVRYQSPAINAEILKLAGRKPLGEMDAKVFEAIALFPKQNRVALKKMFDDEGVNVAMKTKAVLALALVHNKGATALFTQMYKNGDVAAKTTIINVASSSEQGGLFILDLIDKKLFPQDGISPEAMAKIAESHPQNPIARGLAKTAKKFQVAERTKANARIEAYANAAKTMKGNAETGKALFGSCLACHQVGDKGYDFAPALDGSANRDLHHLLTAIVKPNDAMEGGYRIYRITKKDGNIIEGYMYNQNANGTTLGFMGGLKIFIPKEQIKKERFINGHSFMPSSFGKLPEQTMVDLIAYIQTL